MLGVVRKKWMIICMHRMIVFDRDTRPIRRVKAASDIAMEGRIRPIDDMANQAMFNRIQVDVIQMVGKIRFRTDAMLPIAALPDR